MKRLLVSFGVLMVVASTAFAGEPVKPVSQAQATPAKNVPAKMPPKPSPMPKLTPAEQAKVKTALAETLQVYKSDKSASTFAKGSKGLSGDSLRAYNSLANRYRTQSMAPKVKIAKTDQQTMRVEAIYSVTGGTIVGYLQTGCRAIVDLDINIKNTAPVPPKPEAPTPKLGLVNFNGWNATTVSLPKLAPGATATVRFAGINGGMYETTGGCTGLNFDGELRFEDVAYANAYDVDMTSSGLSIGIRPPPSNSPWDDYCPYDFCTDASCQPSCY